MTERVGEVAWVLDHLDDLDADFARFYRVDWRTLSGPRFFSRAQRVSAYGGVMTSVVTEVLDAARTEEPAEEDFFPPLPEGALVVPESAMSGLIETVRG